MKRLPVVAELLVPGVLLAIVCLALQGSSAHALTCPSAVTHVAIHAPEPAPPGSSRAPRPPSLAVAPQEERPGNKLVPTDFEARASAYMSARASVMGFSGAALVAHDGRPIFRAAYGMANREFDIPNTPKTKFRIGSVSKQFTAAAVLLLAQRDAIAITDPVSKHLPDWPEAWSEVTIHHLLTHTGGLPRLTTQAMLDVSALSRTSPLQFEEVPDLFQPGEDLQPPDTKPGEQFAYSNVGYIVLGMIVERVSGTRLSEFLAREIFKPLNMEDTGCEDPGVILRQRACGYTRTDAGLINAAYVDMRFVGGAGSVYSTVDDLLLWNNALDSDHPLQAPAKECLFTPLKADYACGWWIQKRLDRVVQWHGGNVSGFVAHVMRFPADRLFIAILCNVWSDVDRGQLRAMGNELAAIAFGEKYELPREHKRTTMPPAEFEAYVGKYSGKDTFAIAREGDRLMLQWPPGVSVFELFPESRVEFFASRPEYYLTFSMDSAGKVASARIRNEGEEGTWTRMPP